MIFVKTSQIPHQTRIASISWGNLRQHSLLNSASQLLCVIGVLALFGELRTVTDVLEPLARPASLLRMGVLRHRLLPS